MTFSGFETVRRETETFYREPHWDETSGETREELRRACLMIGEETPSRAAAKAAMIAYVLDHARIDVRPYTYFADRPHHAGAVTRVREQWITEAMANHREAFDRTAAGEGHGAYAGNWDFSHTCPDWNEYLRLGFPGILADLRVRLATADADCRVFYEAGITVYEAMIRYALRLADAAERQADTCSQARMVAENLRAVASHEPQTLYQALQLVLLVYWIQTEVEGVNVRSLGRMDTVYASLYFHDLETGVMTEADAAELLRFFFCRLYAAEVDANIPFTLCGYGADGKDVTNAFTRLILDVYAPLGYISPKIQVRLNADTPRDVTEKAMDMIRHGVNSLVFCNDDVIVKALEATGVDHADALNYVLIGCYEPASMGNEIDRTCTGRVSLAKTVEITLNGGRDLQDNALLGVADEGEPRDFEELKAAFYRQLATMIDRSMDRVRVWESVYGAINPSPLFSSAMPYTRAKGVDAYQGGTRYDHSSVDVFAVGTAVDALLAIKQVVFDEQRLTLPAFNDILKRNWEGHEELRQFCLHAVPKYGNHHPQADALAAEIYRFSAECINGKPNGLGGTFRMGGFSIDWFYPFGKATAATADGRLAGDPISKNMSATLSMDREGVTALVQSAAAVDYTQMANGTALDLMVHPTAVAGVDGLNAGIATVKTFFAAGGMALQMNVLDAAVLRRAQENPRQYANLQVRLCGWNVRFVNLSRQEQDDFIKQAEKER